MIGFAIVPYVPTYTAIGRAGSAMLGEVRAMTSALINDLKQAQAAGDRQLYYDLWNDFAFRLDAMAGFEYSVRDDGQIIRHGTSCPRVISIRSHMSAEVFRLLDTKYADAMEKLGYHMPRITEGTEIVDEYDHELYRLMRRKEQLVRGDDNAVKEAMQRAMEKLRLQNTVNILV